MRLPRGHRAVVAGVVPLLLVAACSGDEDPAGDADPRTVLSSAKEALDETSGVHLALSTPEMPDGVSGLTKAEGILTAQPAFEGEIDIVYSGFSGSIPVTAVNGKVYAKLPFTQSFNPVDPAAYGAPDPARLIDPEGGVSSWLTRATGIERGEAARDGDDVLTSYRGRLPGSAVDSAIPSADEGAEFDATFTIDEDGRLRQASVTGPFYQGDPSLTYDVTLTEYGTDKEIVAP